MTLPKLVIIGAGPGGYTAAFRAADLGLAVTLIDTRPQPGGVCLYEGCIPSKALLHAGHIIQTMRHAKDMGIDCAEPRINIDTLRTWKEGIVNKLTGGLGQLTRARKITYIQGRAVFLNSSTIEVQKADQTKEQVSFDRAILATGSSPIRLPGLPSSRRVWDAAAALALPERPSSLLVIGGGYIGLELGSAYAALGAKVSITEALPKLLPSADNDMADLFIRQIRKNFVKIMTGTRFVKGEETSDGILVTLENSKGEKITELYSHVLVSVGRRPDTRDLGLERTNVLLSKKGFVSVDDRRKTNDEAIYAIGDITGQPMLAHKASFEAKIAVDAILGNETALSLQNIPSVVFTDPELAWCGITEEAARAQNIDITVFKFPWAASGRALTMGRADGATKIIAETQTGRLIGVSIVGTNAGELISEGTLAITSGLKAEDLAKTIHPHPTLSETILETAEGIFGHCTHIKNKKS